MKYFITILVYLTVITSTLCAEPLTDADKVKLLQLAEKWQIPQPPQKSTLIMFWGYSSGDADKYMLAFRDPRNEKIARIGFNVVDISNRKNSDIANLTVDESKPINLDRVVASSPFEETFASNNGLLIGIQLVNYGEIDTGWKLFEKSLKQESGHHRSSFKIDKNGDPQLMLAQSCLAAYLNELGSLAPKHESIERRINQLIQDQPAIKSASLARILANLEHSNSYTPGNIGTIQYTVDQYIMGGGSEDMLSPRDVSKEERSLILKGFDAIPELLRQRKSKRFSNHIRVGFNNFVSYPMTADQVIDQYLSEFASNGTGGNWLDRQKGVLSSKQALKQWWKDAKILGEEKYVAKNLLRITYSKKDAKVSLNSKLQLLAEKKYPHLLPKAYERILSTKGQSYALAKAVSGSDTIPDKQKIALFRQAIKTGQGQHRNIALAELREIDAPLADTALIKIINNSSSTTHHAYWLDHNAAISQLCTRSNNTEVWEALHKLLERADLGMKMELINNLQFNADRQPIAAKFFLEVYDIYKNNEVIRDETSSSKFDGPCAGFPFKKISLRDHVHREWARRLKVECDQPNKKWNSEDWVKYRKIVALEIEKFRLSQKL